MSSVTARIKAIKQPRGGYIPPKMFEVIQLQDNNQLFESENIHSSVIGMAVDYLTRYMLGTSVDDAFRVSLMGANIAEYAGYKCATKEIGKYLSAIKGLDFKSILCACKAVTFDVWYRNLLGALTAKRAVDIEPNEDTVHNIRVMVERNLAFFECYGPITQDGFTFDPSGYTQIVDSGDGDFLTCDTLWDLKASKMDPTNKHTLQICMYWIMGRHSGKAIFQNITKIGIFNPRLNKVYRLDIAKIPVETLTRIERDVICFNESVFEEKGLVFKIEKYIQRDNCGQDRRETSLMGIKPYSPHEDSPIISFHTDICDSPEYISKRRSLIGQTKRMNCGMKATVVEDFGCNNITVQFEDGSIKKKCKKEQFHRGSILRPRRQINNPIVLYRLVASHEYDEESICAPRIPEGLEGEDETIPRICTALTTEGCLMSLGVPYIGAKALNVSVQQYQLMHPGEPLDMEKIWMNTRYPFTILGFVVDLDDPNILLPHQISREVPDAMHCGECWILNARQPDFAVKAWLHSATIRDVGVQLSNGVRIRMFKVEDAKWANNDGAPDLQMICDINDAFVKVDKQMHGEANSN